MLVKLFPYQKTGAKWLAGKRTALLADDMGLGKSAQAITAADAIGAKRVLVLCPAVARFNWLAEFDLFSKIKRSQAAITQSKDAVQTELVVCSYDLAISKLKELAAQDWDLLILDECHYLKSRETKRTKAVLGKKGVVHKAKRIWALSGTPAPNHAGEVWPVLYTLGGTKLNYFEFRDRFCEVADTGYGLNIVGTKKSAVGELRKMLEPMMLRRKKEDVLKELPPIFFSRTVVEAGEVDLDREDSFMKWIFPIDRREELRAEIKQQTALASSILDTAGPYSSASAEALKALANSISTLRMYTGLQKVEPIAKMVREELEAKAYEKIVIFACHRGVIEGLRDKLRDFGAVTLYGQTDVGKRQRNVNWFQTNPAHRVFIGNIQAAGTAITLTAAHQVLFAEMDWVPGNNAQAAMRCHRIGQTKPVSVRFVSLKDSIDDRIAQVLQRKTKELAEIFDPGVDSM